MIIMEDNEREILDKYQFWKINTNQSECKNNMNFCLVNTHNGNLKAICNGCAGCGGCGTGT